MKEYDPIFEFPKLRKILTQKGYKIEEKGKYTAVINEEIDLNNPNLPITYTNEGIFIEDDNGIKHQIFLYKKFYRLEDFGKPRFHVLQCSVIKSIGREKYMKANSEPVTVYNVNDNDRKVKVSDLPLCKICARMLTRKLAQITKSSEFIKYLKEKEDLNQKEKIEVDVFGYTLDWAIISEQYRNRKNYTCEKCGIQISEPFDRQYMQTHHKNGKRTDNRDSNLQCLCIRCHSRVNLAHRKNFSMGYNKVLLDEFNELYPE